MGLYSELHEIDFETRLPTENLSSADGPYQDPFYNYEPEVYNSPYLQYDDNSHSASLFIYPDNGEVATASEVCPWS